MANTLTLRLYKDEYNDRLVKMLRENRISNFRLVEESEKVLTIMGEERDLDKLQGLMGPGNEAIIAKNFNDFKTEAEVKEDADDAVRKLRHEMLTRMCEIIQMYQKQCLPFPAEGLIEEARQTVLSFSEKF